MENKANHVLVAHDADGNFSIFWSLNILNMSLASVRLEHDQQLFESSEDLYESMQLRLEQ